jgi:DNA-binding NarL/FixJ family response regulator
MTVRILIVDDHEIVRFGLTALFERALLQVVAAVSSGEEAYEAVKKHQPDIAILDLLLPNGDGLSLLTRLKLDFPKLPVILFSACDNPAYMARALALGAAGYISKESKTGEILNAVRVAAGGDMVWSQEDLRRASGALKAPLGQAGRTANLTNRENEVLKQVALGLTNKEISQSLGISYETVKEHVQHILRKLGVSDRTQAAVWAVRNKLL